MVDTITWNVVIKGPWANTGSANQPRTFDADVEVSLFFSFRLVYRQSSLRPPPAGNQHKAWPKMGSGGRDLRSWASSADIFSRLGNLKVVTSITLTLSLPHLLPNSNHELFHIRLQLLKQTIRRVNGSLRTRQSTDDWSAPTVSRENKSRRF